MGDFLGDKECTTHHHACECRERKFQELGEALADALRKVEYYKNEFNFYFKACNDQDEEIEKLKEALEEANDVIKFYALCERADSDARKWLTKWEGKV